MEGRNAKGQFVKGHKISVGKGRPPRPIEERYFQSFCKSVSIKDWAEATQAILERAKAGDVAAYKILASYAMGNPTIKSEITVHGEIRETYVDVLDRIYGDGESSPEDGLSSDPD